MSAAATAADLWRLADQAQANGIRLFEEPASGEVFATSGSNPRILYRLTAWSCTCRGFATWQRCQHHSMLLCELGWLPDVPDPEPDPAGPAALPSASEEPDPWHAPVPVSPAAVPANVVAFPSAEGRAAALAETVEDSIERLAAQLVEGRTEGFEAYLRFVSRFHRYSARNTLLIAAQRPDATLVAGMKHWNSLGYRIRAGEKAIWVLAPITRKEVDEETGEVAERAVAFRPAPVFDASQLDGLEERPLPTPRPVLPDDAGELYLRVKGRVEAAGIRVLEDILPEGVDGVSKGGSILIKGRLGSRDKLLVLLHELSHELGHKGGNREGTTAQQRELEAESVAFVAASALGLDHPGARHYLSGWRVTPDELRASLSAIQGLVRRVLATVVPETRAEPMAFQERPAA